MAPTSPWATPAWEGMGGHRCPGGYSNAGEGRFAEGLRTGGGGCLGRQHGGRGGDGRVPKEESSWRTGMHLCACCGRAPTSIADGPQAWIGTAETERQEPVMVLQQRDATNKHMYISRTP